VVSEETDAELTVTTSYADAETASVTVGTGEEVDLFWSMAAFGYSSYLSSDPTAYLYVRILRGATVIYSETTVASTPAVDQLGIVDGSTLDVSLNTTTYSHPSGMDFDAPSAGTYTYKLQVKKSAGAWLVSKRRLRAVLRKA